MSDTSKIEWTDATWNPVRGCVKVSAGCKHCYAEAFAERFRGVPGHPYEQGFDQRLVPEKLTEPLSWKKPRRVFVNSMSDLFQDGVPDAYIDRVFAVMALAPQHTFQVLTKRAERMHAYLSDASRRAQIAEQWWDLLPGPEPKKVNFSLSPLDTWPLPNVWLGVSVENQHYADERIPLLLQTPAAVRFISAEPLLASVDFDPLWIGWVKAGYNYKAQKQIIAHHRDPVFGANKTRPPMLDWVIDGAESGHGARDYRIEWSISLQRQCEAAGVAYFRKQLGPHPIVSDLTHWRCSANLLPDGSGYRLKLRDKKGGDIQEWPGDLRIRQFPDAQREGRP